MPNSRASILGEQGKDELRLMTQEGVAAVVLAAGKGTRMKSARPKVMHEVASWPMILHVLKALEPVAAGNRVVVVAEGMATVEAAVAPTQTVIQKPQLGTGHAVLCARDALSGFRGTVLVVFGDTPLITSETLSKMVAAREAGSSVVVLGYEPQDPTGYGRLITDSDGGVTAIVEHKDATPEQRKIALCNATAMAIDANVLFDLLDRVGDDNAQGEIYLTSVVELACKDGLSCGVVIASDIEVMGVDSRAGLARAETLMQERLRSRALDAGVTMTDPSTVYLSADTILGEDVVVGPNVFFGPDVRIGNNVTIKAFSHLEGATVEEGAIIGPFARLRPETTIGREAHVGTFVEVKKSSIEAGAKVPHLTYIGDARVGAGTNVGAGTITCNYDGYDKNFTDIGVGVFIGSNNSLVAPVTIGDGAYTGAGSTITRDVPADSLAVGRGEQFEREGWAIRFRAKKEGKVIEAAPENKKQAQGKNK